MAGADIRKCQVIIGLYNAQCGGNHLERIREDGWSLCGNYGCLDFRSKVEDLPSPHINCASTSVLSIKLQGRDSEQDQIHFCKEDCR